MALLIRITLLLTLMVPASAWADCASDRDCKLGRFCVGGVCRDWAGQCFKDVDCDGDLVCESGLCLKSGAAAPAGKAAATTSARPASSSDYGTLTEKTAEGASAKLSRQFKGAGFYVAYNFVTSSKKDEHQLQWPDLGFYVRFDRDRELKIRGEKGESQDLGGAWRYGGEGNKVQMWFDGSELLLDINGERVGPLQVSKQPRGTQVGPWRLRIDGSRAQMQNLVVKPWDGALE